MPYQHAELVKNRTAVEIEYLCSETGLKKSQACVMIKQDAQSDARLCEPNKAVPAKGQVAALESTDHKLQERMRDNVCALQLFTSPLLTVPTVTASPFAAPPFTAPHIYIHKYRRHIKYINTWRILRDEPDDTLVKEYPKFVARLEALEDHNLDYAKEIGVKTSQVLAQIEQARWSAHSNRLKSLCDANQAVRDNNNSMNDAKDQVAALKLSEDDKKEFDKQVRRTSLFTAPPITAAHIYISTLGI